MRAMLSARTSLCLALATAAILFAASAFRAQAPASQPAVPQWQLDAGGKMAFDVVSVKPNKTNEELHQLAGGVAGANARTNVAMAGTDRPATGGLFSASDYPLGTYIAFAYKLTSYQTQFMVPHLPKWTTAERFDVEAHAGPNVSKDQMRLMMQSLLEDRFKLTAHFETQQGPVFALALLKAGKTGPQLIPHSDQHPCADKAPPPGSPPTPASKDGFPSVCGATSVKLASGQMHVRSPGASMGQIASYLLQLGNLDRPVLNQTGLSGEFDFGIDFAPEFSGPPPANFQPDSSGPTFLEALKEQLGLKLESSTGPVDVLVIDQIEEPSPN